MQQKRLPIDDSTLRSIPKNKPFISLFSGGKDSGLALSMACEIAQPMALIHCMEDERSIHHKQSKETIEQQASSLNIPLVFHDNHWTKWPKLIKLFQHYKQKGAEFVVYGDLFREDNAQLQITLCQSAGLIPCMPLWHTPYEILVEQMEVRSLTSIITVIKSPYIDLYWLGKAFDRYAYKEFSDLEIDAFGEYGEFHTTLINADIFKYPLNYQTTEEDNGIIDLEIIRTIDR